MILEIRLSNFFSIKDEVVLDMQAANLQTKQAKTLEGNTFVVGGERLLKRLLSMVPMLRVKVVLSMVSVLV